MLLSPWIRPTQPTVYMLPYLPVPGTSRAPAKVKHILRFCVRDGAFLAFSDTNIKVDYMGDG